MTKKARIRKPQTVADWLRENARFGAPKLAAALGVGTGRIAQICANEGISLAALKKTAGIPRNKVAPGNPPRPPRQETGAALKRLPTRPAEFDGAVRAAGLRERARDLARENARLASELGKGREDLDAVMAAVRSLPAKSPFIASPRARHQQKPVAATILGLADWHFGEVVDPKAIRGYNGYNVAILTQRMEALRDRFIRTTEALRGGYDIRELVILYLGDMVSGDIHQELALTNEYPMPQQAVLAGDFLAWFVRELVGAFERLTVHYLSTGNHGRLSAKPQYKRAGLDNWEWVSGAVAQRALAGQSNVTFTIHDEVRPKVDIFGRPCLLEHGDGYMSSLGTPHYAIQRGIGREAWKAMYHKDSFRYLFMGHHHHRAQLEDGAVWIVGSPKGLCEFSHKKQLLSAPSQTSWLVGKHGIFHKTDYELDQG